MNKKLLALALITALTIGLNTQSYAATSASTTLTGTLSAETEVSFTGGTTATSINIDTGALATAFAPSFSIHTNATTQNLTLSATTTDASGSVNAMYHITTQPYLILCNTATVPTHAAVTDIKSGTPTASLNPNAIAYTIGTSINNSGTSTYNNTNENYDVVANNGITALTLTSGTSPATETYAEYVDLVGDYRATVTLTVN